MKIETFNCELPAYFLSGPMTVIRWLIGGLTPRTVRTFSMPRKIRAYCMDWHIDKSDAFRDMLVEPLKSSLNIELVAWDGESLPARELRAKGPLIFCMLPPPLDFAKQSGRPIVWLPMWDQAQGYDQAWWNTLPKNIRVVAFSGPIDKHATAAGLKVLKLQYYKNPNEYEQVSWQAGNKIFYWNRTGMIGPAFLEKLCWASNANELLFYGKLDPRINVRMNYGMPSRLADCAVKTIEPSQREEFLELTEPANIVVAPRVSEGVGMTFLEAMARGCAVLAYDAPTMNEYIEDGVNGLLFSNHRPSVARKLKNRLKSPFHSLATPYLLGENQDWANLKRVDFQALGNKARWDHEQGYFVWGKSLAKYAHFIAE